MVRVSKVVMDEKAHAWLSALIDLSKKERRETLGKFCFQCGINYRHLYPVIDGKSAISETVLQALKDRAKALGIESTIQAKILSRGLGIE